jgi:hypothetical protein
MVEPVGIGSRGSTNCLIYLNTFKKSLTNFFLFAPLGLRNASVVFAFGGVSFLFALMQKETKKSRPKDAPPTIPTRHLAFGPFHRALWLRNRF